MLSPNIPFYYHTQIWVITNVTYTNARTFKTHHYPISDSDGVTVSRMSGESRRLLQSAAAQGLEVRPVLKHATVNTLTLLC